MAAVEKVRTPLEVQVRRLIRISVGLYVIVAVLGVLGWVLLQRETTRTNKALCTFRGDLVDRVHDSDSFLRRHPKGIPGIATASEIRVSRDNQQRTVKSLSALNCPPKEIP